ncbi:RluA family pseudouridine synthase [Sporosarcina sp. FA9]|uniref:RluA family pseudouridine synthase n=1 Tax=Sporosarcina sp. FA9 TaxID=3413030 RepID=UPI003F659687
MFKKTAVQMWCIILLLAPIREKGAIVLKRETNNSVIYTVKESGELLPFLLESMKNSSRNSVKSILTRGQVTINGKMIKQHNHLLEIDDKVEILSNQVAESISKIEGVTILHEDEDIIVINKNAGILSVASEREKEMTAYRQITEYVKRLNPKNRIFVVHRLDKATSGIMLFAKSERVQQALQNTWSDTVKERMYTALVEGTVIENKGTIASWLTENSSFKVYSSPVDNGGQHAITHYKKIQSNKHFSLLEVQLETGRKNQIRVHLEVIGHPVAGDKKYGSTGNPLRRLGLHATALSLIHPRTGKLVRYTAEVPNAFLIKSK